MLFRPPSKSLSAGAFMCWSYSSGYPRLLYSTLKFLNSLPPCVAKCITKMSDIKSEIMLAYPLTTYFKFPPEIMPQISWPELYLTPLMSTMDSLKLCLYLLHNLLEVLLWIRWQTQDRLLGSNTLLALSPRQFSAACPRPVVQLLDEVGFGW